MSGDRYAQMLVGVGVEDLTRRCARDPSLEGEVM